MSGPAHTGSRAGAHPPALSYSERPAATEPRGLLILHHGRGTDEHDLLPLVNVYRPAR